MSNANNNIKTTGYNTTPPLFVINMPKDADRREGIAARARDVGVDLTFIEAVNGREMSDEAIATVYDSARRKRFFGRDMTKGEIGCLLSHRKIFEKMIAENIPLAAVLEDDVIFEADFKEALSALTQNTCHSEQSEESKSNSPSTDPSLTLKMTKQQTLQWDVIRFLGSAKIYKRGCRKIAPLGGTRYHYARLPTAPGGAHGYLLTRHAAEIMLRHMRRNWVPIDTLQGRMWETGLETLVLYPAPLYPDPAAETTIGNDTRFDKTVRLEGLPRLLYPLTRAWYKITDTLGKKWIYWGSWLKDKKAV